jgi:NADPH:quinone reductase-like Zn-dependent oxidoreductase
MEVCDRFFSRYIINSLHIEGAARNGAFAEFVVAQAGLLFRLPDIISFEEGAQMGVACMTACYSLYLSLDLPTPYDTKTIPQTTLLVWSGSTSVGQIVMQLAKLSNMRVIATASPKQFDFVRSLGADEVYDYSDSFTGREIFQATEGNIHHAVDCWSEGMSPYQVSASLSNDHGKIAGLLPYQSRKKGIESTFVFAYAIFGKVCRISNSYHCYPYPGIYH